MIDEVKKFLQVSCIVIVNAIAVIDGSVDTELSIILCEQSFFILSCDNIVRQLCYLLAK